MPAIEEAGGLQARRVDAIEAARVHGNPVGLRARYVKRVHAAMRAEGVLGHAGAEGVDREGIFPSQQFEILRRGRQVKDALLCANRAAALRQQCQIYLRPEAHPAAMAAAFALLQHYPYSSPTFAAIFSCSVCSMLIGLTPKHTIYCDKLGHYIVTTRPFS